MMQHNNPFALFYSFFLSFIYKIYYFITFLRKSLIKKQIVLLLFIISFKIFNNYDLFIKKISKKAIFLLYFIKNANILLSFHQNCYFLALFQSIFLNRWTMFAFGEDESFALSL